MQFLAEGEPGEQPRVDFKQQFETSPRPFDLLFIKSGERGRNQSFGQHFGGVNRFPPFGMEPHGGVHVFGKTGCVSPDGIECPATESAVGPDCLNRSVIALADFGGTVKMVGLLGCTFGDQTFLLVVVGLNDLHIAHLRIIEVGDDSVQKLRTGNMVRIHDHHQFAFAVMFQGIVDVACLGILFPGPCDVVDAVVFAELFQKRIVGLVAEVGFVGILNGLDCL